MLCGSILGISPFDSPASGLGLRLFKENRKNLLVDHTGIEPATSCLQGTRHPIASSGPDLARIALVSLRLNLTHKLHQDAKQGCF